MIGLFCLVTAGQVFLKRTNLAAIVEDFTQGSATNKLEQIRTLQAADVDGIPGLVSAVADQEDRVSAAATESLLDMNRQWITLPTQAMLKRRTVLAESIAGVAQTLDPNTDSNSDGRWARLEYLARRAAEDLLDAGSAETDQAYRQLMQVVANHQNAASAPPRPLAASPEDMFAREPLPIELVDNADSRWTQWPPTTSTPSIYDRRVASVESFSQRDVILQQTDADASAHRTSDARLLRPRMQPAPIELDSSERATGESATDEPASTLAEQTQRQDNGQLRSTADWILQLASRSRLVRMHAAAEIVRLGDDRGIEALRLHLQSEPDPEVVRRVTQLLER